MRKPDFFSYTSSLKPSGIFLGQVKQVPVTSEMTVTYASLAHPPFSSLKTGDSYIPLIIHQEDNLKGEIVHYT